MARGGDSAGQRLVGIRRRDQRCGTLRRLQHESDDRHFPVPALAARRGALLGANLQNVLAAAVFARILAAILLGRSALKVLEIRSILPPQLGVAKGLFNFGGWMLIASVTNMIAESLDRVMLGTSLGARFVTYYTVPQNLVTRLNIVPTAMVRTLFARLSAVGRADADTITQQSLEFLNGVFTPVALIAMLVLEPFLHLWVGNEIATVAAPVGRIMIVAVWLVGPGER